MLRCFYSVTLYSELVCLCTDFTSAAAEGDQRFCRNEWRARDDLYVFPQQPSAPAVGHCSLPVTQASQQLGRRPRTPMRLHTELDQKRPAEVILDLRLLLSAG